MISNMHRAASQIDLPILVINGGLDYFTPPEYAESFFAEIPKSSKNQHHYYPKSYHLLMYDDYRIAIFNNVSEWISERECQFNTKSRLIQTPKHT